MKHMHYTFVLFSAALMLLFSSVQNFVSAQARLVLGNASAAYLKMSGGTAGTPIYLVIGNASTNAAANTIVKNSTAGIISEGQYNLVKWYVGAPAAGTYTLPWIDDAGGLEDVSVRFVATGGVLGGFFLASTYDGVADNATYMPAPVTSMASSPASLANASLYVIDRFWSLIDETDYTTKPAFTSLIFTYPDNEHNPGSGNTITEGNLGAQRWNTTATAKWDGIAFPPTGVVDAGLNTVTLTSVAAANVYRWWTLVDNTTPLPVEWLDVSAECNRGDVTIKWSTASEQNADYFTVERSIDGTTFSAIATKPAAGNSSVVNNYSAVDADPYAGTSFYRVRQTDFNGDFSFSNMITVTGCSSDDVFMYSMDGGAVININALKDGKYNIELYDVLGQKMAGQVNAVSVGSNQIKLKPGNIASAVYVVKVYNNTNAVAQKLFIKSNHTQ